MSQRIYLDNAATSWPKPEAVYRAVEHAMRTLGAAAGRSAYREASEVQRGIDTARAGVARLIGLDQPRQVIFASSGTDALNLAVHGLLRPGDHVVTTAAEHNSVLRPLHHEATTRAVELSIVPCDAQGMVDARDVAAALRPTTRLVVMLHASNVTGAMQPVAEVGALLRGHPALLLVDAAQSLGHLPILFEQLGCDLLAAPGHKGLLGPLGTGILAIRPGVESQLVSLRQGGTGSRSDRDQQPDELPDKYEPGNLNVPGILGLAAGVAYLAERGLDDVRRHELALLAQLQQALAGVPGVQLLGPSDTSQRVGVVSLRLAGYDPQEVAAMLDGVHRIQGRAGLHCAPRMHESLGTLPDGGTVRLSFSPFTTSVEIDAACRALAELATSRLA